MTGITEILLAIALCHVLEIGLGWTITLCILIGIGRLIKGSK